MAILEVASVAVGIACSFILYQCALVIQRLYFSPLSKFPGPKFAAATYLVDFYYDVIKGEGGQLAFVHRKWHEKYGPIIRINPDELHVQDSSWYETLYAPSRPVRKLPDWGHRFNSSDSLVSTNDTALYRLRRSVMNPFFAKRRIAEFGPELQRMCNQLVSRLETEYQGSGRALNLSYVWECFASDVVTFTTLGYDPGFVQSPNFSSPTNRAMEALVESTKLFTYVEILPIMVELLPKRVAVALMPSVKLVFGFWEVCCTKNLPLWHP